MNCLAGVLRPGYKVHAAADAVAPIVIAISLSPGNEHDGHHAGELIDPAV